MPLENTDLKNLVFREEKNFIEALAAGASMSVLLVANIAVMLIAFIAVLAFVDGVLCWGGNLVGVCITFKVCFFTLFLFIISPFLPD